MRRPFIRADGGVGGAVPAPLRCRAVARVAACVVCLLGIVGLAPWAPAAEAITFQTTLSPIRLNALPGQVVTSQYFLSLDPSETRAQFRVHVEDWWRSEDGRESFYVPPGTLPRSCGSWVTVNPGEASVAGGEQLSVRVTVNVPVAVDPGGYWCALTIDEVPDPLDITPDDVNVRFLASVSTAIYVSVEPVNRAVRITGLDLSSDDVVLELRNDGNTPVSVEGRIEFSRQKGDAPVAVIPLERHVLLMTPVAVGRYRTPLPDPTVLGSGQYIVRVVLDIGLDHFIGAQRELRLERDRLHASAKR